MLTRNYWTYGLFTIRCKLANDLHVFYGSSIIALYEKNTIKNNLIYQIIQLYSEHRGEIASTLRTDDDQYLGFEDHLSYNLTEEFNEYTLEWNEKQISWSINGYNYWNQSIEQYFYYNKSKILVLKL
jgi:hypothetical protein